MENNEQIIRLVVILEKLGEKVVEMSSKIDRLESSLNSHVITNDSRLAVNEEKVKKLEGVVKQLNVLTGGIIIDVVSAILTYIFEKHGR